MPKVRLKKVGPLRQACYNCGRTNATEVVTEIDGETMGWRGCDQCWPLVPLRGQLDFVRQLCIESWNRSKGKLPPQRRGIQARE